MTWPEVEMYANLMARTEPGPGVQLADTEPPYSPHLKMRSIPNVETTRLLWMRLWLHDQLHTVDGLRDHDDTRRALVNGGLRVKAINHELKLRGYHSNGCTFCDEGEGPVPSRLRSTGADGRP